MEKIRAHCLVKLAPQKLETVVEEIQQIPGIQNYSVITGDYDGVIDIEVDSMSDLYELYKKIEKVDGIVDTNTHVVMKRFEFQ
ncbi:MAG TPA: Lrp/AsnC ligand binding domain-containing protein [Candidatus Lokiarchaeia archaeon]|nr:Lrp/AsnC ligand binding domain-containing protein [Candidatus Lokiarchaeia archaeon]